MEYDLDDGSDTVAPNCLDIAACDGPVRFHRILNPVLADSDDNARGESSNTEDDMDTQVDVVSDGDVTDNNVGKTFIMPNKSDTSSGATYKCVFCNHIFKSHYCYQKHKRRHLNPFTVDFTTLACSNGNSNENSNENVMEKKIFENALEAPASPTISNENSVPSTLKDINVQFFPCKICGAKFPSYYFVHKHKKIWHPEAVIANLHPNGGDTPIQNTNENK